MDPEPRILRPSDPNKLAPYLPLPLTPEALRRFFHPAAVERGRGYCAHGAVESLWVGDGTLEASVRGTAPKPYQVTIHFRRGGDPIAFCDCTCLVQTRCKHAVAALLKAGGAARNLPDQNNGNDDAPEAGGSRLASRAAEDWLKEIPQGPSACASQPAAAEEVLWILQAHPAALSIHARAAKRRPDGAHEAFQHLDIRALAKAAAKTTSLEDRWIAACIAGTRFGEPDWPITTKNGIVTGILFDLIRTGRCRLQDVDGPILQQGPALRAQLVWEERTWRDRTAGQNRLLIPTVAPLEGGLLVLKASAPWHVDPKTGVAGLLQFDAGPAQVAWFLRGGPVPEAGIEHVAAAIRGSGMDGIPIPTPAAKPKPKPVVTLDEPPIPQLRLRRRTIPVEARNAWIGGPAGCAELSFRYGRAEASPCDPHVLYEEHAAAEIRLRHRRRDLEAEAAQELTRRGLIPKSAVGEAIGSVFVPDDADAEAAWASFVHRVVPALRAQGWTVDIDEGFGVKVLDAAENWDLALSPSPGAGGWWFEAAMGVVVDGQRVDLVPVLTEIVRRMPRPSGEDFDAAREIESLGRDGFIYGRAGGAFVALPLDRVKRILMLLVEFLDPRHARGQPPRLPASTIEELEAIVGAKAVGPRDLLLRRRETLHALRQTRRLQTPKGFRGNLRTHQKTGLGWLATIAEHQAGGILADEMGTGKMIHVLAHVSRLVANRALRGPALVVAPTSALGEWTKRAKALTPDLRVVRWHGPERGQIRDEIPQAHIVLTNYHTLARDMGFLGERKWGLVALDEAQAIKNPAALTAQAAATLKADHRLCLTGTPIQNTLTELWSLFAFLMPGLLGDSKSFGRVFKRPIEEYGDGARHEVLMARIAPFLLRRTKEDAKIRLPRKTIETVKIELGGRQRDLYETLRVAQLEAVKAAVAQRGWKQSSVAVLAALQAMRSACDHPRLVNRPEAQKISESAKLEHLMRTLPGLIVQGRRVLVFSVWTRMLDLIEPELARQKISFLRLDGQMPIARREDAVERFQNGEGSVFLISLMAGGTALNLTAADTVVLFDPWWNPAVENQAMDRVHRIGQTKPVTVYKLIVAGSLEERMLDLQARKSGLADAVLGEGRGLFRRLNIEDFERLFAPQDAEEDGDDAARQMPKAA